MQTVHAVTINGEIAIRRRVWWAPSQGCHTPLDEWLGLDQKYSQGVREMVCRVGLDGSYRKAGEDLSRLSLIRLSYRTLRAVFQREGHALRPLPPRPQGAEQRGKEAKLVTFHDPPARHQHVWRRRATVGPLA